MLDEAKAMIKVSKHDHIVNIQGISVNESCVYLLLEFCSNGAIEDYLQKNQKEFTKKLRDNTSREIICWSKQVADAMGFLAKKDIIHVSTGIPLFTMLIWGNIKKRGKQKPCKSRLLSTETF